MHLGKVLVLLSISSGAYSFKIRAFTGKGCTGKAQEINVWDNTCRNTQVIEARSFRVLAYGAHRQRAAFYDHGECIGGPKVAWTDYWADGGSDTFKKDACLDLDFGAWAYGSRSA